MFVPAGRENYAWLGHVPFYRQHAGVAQLVEHLICNQRVGGSNPFASSRFAVLSAPRSSRSKPGRQVPELSERTDPSSSFPEPICAKAVLRGDCGVLRERQRKPGERLFDSGTGGVGPKDLL